MKTRFSKKLISILLSLLMVVSALPMSAITASAEVISSTTNEVYKFDFKNSTPTTLETGSSLKTLTDNAGHTLNYMLWGTSSVTTGQYMKLQDAFVNTPSTIDTGIKGDCWNVVYRYNKTSTSKPSATLIGLGTTGGSGSMADLIYITADGYIETGFTDSATNLATSVGKSLYNTAATSPEELDIGYDNGKVTVKYNAETVFTKDISSNTTLNDKFKNGVGSFFIGANKYVSAGGTYFDKSHNSSGQAAYIEKLYDLTGSVTEKVEAGNIAPKATVTSNAISEFTNNIATLTDGNKENATENRFINWNVRSQGQMTVTFTWDKLYELDYTNIDFYSEGWGTFPPKKLDIYASTDGTTFGSTPIMSYTNDGSNMPSVSSSANVYEKEYKFPSNTKVMAVKFVATVRDGSIESGKYATGFAEIEIFGAPAPVDPAQQAQALKDAMTAFETKVKTGANYKNIKPAYTAYVNAQKAYDTYVYGGDSSVNLTSYITALNNATNSISAWTAPTYNAYAKFSSDEDSNVYKYYKNALWVDSTNTDSTSTNSNVDGRFVRMYYQDGVYVYDGEDPIIPIMFGYDGDTHYIFYVGLNGNYTNGLEFVGPWMGADSSGNANVTVRRFSLAFANQYKAFSSTVGTDSPRVKITGGYHLFANQIRAKGSTIFNGSETSAYKQITFGNYFKIKHFNYDEPNNSKCWVNEGSLNASGNNRKLYVINYKPVKDYISNNSSKLTNIANYSEGGASEVVNNFNNIGEIVLSSLTVSNISSSNTAVINLDTAIRYFSANTATQNSTQYASLRSAMNETVRTIFNGGVNDEGYTETSWNNFVTAYNNAKAVMARVNTSGYIYSSEAGTKATALTAAYNALTKCDHATTERVGVVEANCSTAGYTGDLTCTNCNEIIEKGTVIPVNKDNHTKDNHVGGLNGTWTHQNGSSTNNHYQQCLKCKEYVYINCEFNRVETQATCESAGFVTYTCNECGYSYREDGDHATGHDYDENFVCKHNCGTSIDISAFTSAVASAEAELAETDKYTAKSLASLKAVVDSTTITPNVDNQDAVNAKAGEIVTAINALVLNSFNATLNIVNYDTKATISTKTYSEIRYGTVVNFDASELMPADSYINKWVASQTEKDLLINSSSTKVSYVVYDNTSIYCYVTEKAVDTENKVKVTLVDKSNRVTGIAYVTSSSIFSKNANELTVDGQTLTATTYPFYQVKEFRVQHTATIVTENGYQVTSDIVIEPIYEAKANNLIITTDENQTVTINGNIASRYNAYWDERIVVSNENAVAWYADGYLVAYGTSYQFQATSSVEITYETSSDNVDTSLASSRIDYAAYDSTLDYSRIVVSNCVPNGATIVKQGIKILTSSKVGATVASQKVIDGTKEFVANTTTKTGTQFVINLSTNDAVKTIAVVSFVTYEIGDKQYTVWSSKGDVKATMISK